MKHILKIDKRKKDSMETQVIQALRTYIFSPSLAPDTLLPLPEVIAQDYGVDVKSLEHFYESQVRLGTIVKDDETYRKANRSTKIYEAFNSQRSLQSVAAQMGISSKTEKRAVEIVHSFETYPFCPVVHEGEYLKVTRLNYFDEHAEVMVIIYINLDVLSEARTFNYDQASYYELMKPYLNRFKGTKRYISACELPEMVAKTLNVPKSTPGLITYQYTVDANDILAIYYEVYSITEAFYVFGDYDYNQVKKL